MSQHEEYTADWEKIVAVITVRLKGLYFNLKQQQSKQWLNIYPASF